MGPDLPIWKQLLDPCPGADRGYSPVASLIDSIAWRRISSAVTSVGPQVGQSSNTSDLLSSGWEHVDNCVLCFHQELLSGFHFGNGVKGS